MAAKPQHPDGRARLLNAALRVIRTKGYAAATVDDICHEAGVTKGSFFYHFKSKDDLALGAAAHFAEGAAALFAGAPYHDAPDPLDRVLGYLDFRTEILRGELPDFTCLLGTLVQETYQSHPAIREACDCYISAHAAEVAEDIAEAKRLYARAAEWDPQSLGLYTQAVLQGAFILAKAKHGPAAAADCIAHLRRYIESLLPRPTVHTTTT
ncbi:MAG: TetR/AcrR family transcriptional regulator [Phycisphaerales bacterium]|nr:TetR/AcrR family transcriptional regulator [Phycisphaerales bacterium]